MYENKYKQTPICHFKKLYQKFFYEYSLLQHLAWPLLEQRRAESRLTLFHRIVHKEVDINEHVLMERNLKASCKGNSVQFRWPQTSKDSLSGMLYLQGMICHSSRTKSGLLTCVMAVHSTNHAFTKLYKMPKLQI